MAKYMVCDKCGANSSIKAVYDIRMDIAICVFTYDLCFKCASILKTAINDTLKIKPK